jgi:hypothetical protein
MSKTTNDFCSAEKIQICINKNKICNTKTGRCINKPKTNASAKSNIVTNTTIDNSSSDKVSTSTKKVINTKKTILDFIKELGKKKYKTAKDVINDIFNKKEDDDDAIKVINEINEFNNNASKKGYIYELLWDICIKFGITDFTKEKSEHAIGNFNIFHNFKNIKEYINYYLKQGYISSNSGGYSDITFRTKEQNKDTQYNLNLVSVKYITGKDIKNYDIQNLCTLIRDRENDDYKSINTLLFVKDKEDFKKICKSANQSSNVLIKYISPRGNYENVYDLQDLEKHYINLLKVLELYNFLYDETDKEKFKKNFLNVKEKILKPFVPRFHQQLIIKSIQKHINKEKKILVGAIPRSGKTYIMAGTILEDVKKNPPNTFKNYIIITPAPTETLSQYEDAFNDYIDFKEKNIEVVNVKNEGTFKKHENKNIVYIVSKQKLGIHNNNNEDELKNDKNKAQKIADKLIKLINGIKFEIMFYDEAHYGMSTETAEYIFKNIKSKDQKEIYVTATYNKPTNVYKITRIFNWGLQDVDFLDNYKNNKIDKLIEYFSKNFDQDIVKDVVENNFNNKIDYITKDYKHFPEPFLLTSVWHKDFLDEQLKLLEGESNYGFDMDKLFTYFKDGITFENETQLKILFEYYLGYPIKNVSIENIKYFKFKEIENNNKNDRTNISQDEKYKELNKIDIENDTISKSNSIYQNILQEYKNIYYEKDSKIYIPIPKYKYKNRDYKDVDFLKKRGIIPRIREVCMNECRTLQHVKHKTSQLWFLPGGTPGRLLDNIIFSLLYFLKNNFNDFFKSHMFFICRNESEIKTKKKSDKQEIKDKVERNETEYKKLKENFKNICFQDDQDDVKCKTQKDDDIKTQIKNIENYIKKEDKYRGLIILTGGKLKLGVSLPNVDIVTLFSNTMSPDSIFQMLFRSMTEIEDNNTNCNITEYCPKKKYGFMVDLKPQRILRILHYINTKMLSKEQRDDKNKKEYIPIGDLINIDKDVFINKYDYNKSKTEIKKEIKNYSEAYLEKLLDTNDYSNNKDIKNIINLYDFYLNKFDKDILWYLQNFHLEQAAFHKKFKEKVMPTGKKVEKKSKKEDDEDGGEDIEYVEDEDYEDVEYKSKDIVKDGEDKDINEINKNLKEIVLISISLLSLICDNYCLFDNKNNKINMIEINKIFEDMKGNKKNICNNDGEDNLKDIFINGFKDRITNNIPGKSNEDMFNLIKDIFSNIKEKDDYINGGRKKIGGNILSSLNHLLKSQRQQIYTIETPDELLEQINKTIPFTKKAKDERGEVFTPMKLVNEMLDTLPEEVWKNPDLKWLDPAAGMGNFPVAVYMRLMKGLRYVRGYEDDEKRKKHILENMLYMVEIDKTNVFMMRKIFCGKIYKLNIFEGSFIDGKYSCKTDIFNIIKDVCKKENKTCNFKASKCIIKPKNIKLIEQIKKDKNINFVNKIKSFDNIFDIIVGNPPYQKYYDNMNARVGGSSLWSQFLNKSINLLIKDGFLLFITPCSWMSGGSNPQSGNILGGVMQINTLYYLNIQECSKYFNVGSTFSYYLIKKSIENKEFECICKYNNIVYNSKIKNEDFRKMKIIPLLFNHDMLSIIKKIEKSECEKMNFKRVRDLDRDAKKDLYNEDGKYCVKHKVVEIYKTNYKQECMGKHKVIISMPGYIKAEYDKKCGCSDATLFMYCDNKNEAINIINLLNSKPYKLIINVYREITGLNNHKNINKFPIIKTNNDIYDYFKFTKSEKNLIENNTKDFIEKQI